MQISLEKESIGRIKILMIMVKKLFNFYTELNNKNIKIKHDIISQWIGKVKNMMRLNKKSRNKFNNKKEKNI
jgi:hypothetical protein